MMDLWFSLPAAVQDSLMTLALVMPGALAGLYILRGYAPWGLTRAILLRFRGTVAVFVVLIAASVGLGIALSAQERGLRHGTAIAADKFDLVVAAPGSEITAMLAAVYLQPSDMGLLDGDAYNAVATHEKVEFAAPLAFGDSYNSAPVVGTTAEFLSYLSDGMIVGRMWHDSEEAVVGALVSLEIGDTFSPAHGEGEAEEEDVHEDHHLHVVGRMAATGTPWDRAILIPIEAVWEVHGLANGHRVGAEAQLGAPFDPEYFPGTPVIVVHPKELWASYSLRSEFTREAQMMAFFPGTVLATLYRIMGDIRQAMSFMALVTQILVAASVLASLFILTRLFSRTLSLLRAIGAPDRFVFAVVWSFGAALLVAGCLLGLGGGIAMAAILSAVVTARTDIYISATLGWHEIHFVAGFVSAALILALIPARLALKSDIVASLRG